MHKYIWKSTIWISIETKLLMEKVLHISNRHPFCSFIYTRRGWNWLDKNRYPTSSSDFLSHILCSISFQLSMVIQHSNNITLTLYRDYWIEFGKLREIFLKKKRESCQMDIRSRSYHIFKFTIKKSDQNGMSDVWG